MHNLFQQPFYSCLTNKYWQYDTGKYSITYQSVQNGRYEYDYVCTCPAYKFSKDEKKCKHIEEVKHLRCGWSQFLHGGQPVVDNNGVKRCPECGEEVEVLLIGV